LKLLLERREALTFADGEESVRDVQRRIDYPSILRSILTYIIKNELLAY